MVFKPGLMGSSGDPANVPAGFAGSMAAYIEAALDLVLQAEGLPKLVIDSNTSDVRDRRMLFVAIAQGVSAYLADNPTVFTPPNTVGFDLPPGSQERLVP